MRIKTLFFDKVKTRQDLLAQIQQAEEWLKTYQGEHLHLQLAYLEKIPEERIPDTRELLLFFEGLPQTRSNVTVEVVDRKDAYHHLNLHYDNEWERDFREIHPMQMYINGEEANVLTLDFTHCKTWWELHTILKETYGFPEYYGKNADALFDLLRYYTSDRFHTRIIGLKHLPKDLMKIEMTKVLSVFDDVHRELPNKTFEIVD